MPAIINSDDGVLSGSSGLKTSGANDGILALQNNGTTNVTVTAAGSVGVGTSSPARKVTIVGVDGSAGQTEGNSRTSLFLNNNGANYISIHTSTTGDGGIFFSDNGNNNGAVVYETTNDALYFKTNNAEQARITSAGLFQFNSGYGSVATAYGCRAWVNFNGTGTVAIRASGNVTSITDNGVGDYTVNFTTAMPDANYSVAGTASKDAASVAGSMGLNETSVPSTSAVRVYGISFGSASNALGDRAYMYVAIFR